MNPLSASPCWLCRRASAIVPLVLALAGSGLARPTSAAQPGGALQPAALNQIAALLAEKAARTPAEQKIDSNLLYAFRRATGVKLSVAAATLRTGMAVSARQTIIVDITSYMSDALLKQIEALGGKIIAAYPQYRSIRAEVPIDQILAIAGWDAVVFIQPEQQAMTAGVARSTPSRMPASVEAPALHARLLLPPAGAARPLAAQLASTAATQGITITNPVNRSEGDLAHRADQARRIYGYTGAGVKVCVLSNGVDSLEALQASGDLPPMTVVPNAAGIGDEGSAMLEIIHDLAPGAQLFYATGFGGIASFAANIKTLRDSNDYDLFLLNTSGSTVINTSTNVQNGARDPYEQTGFPPMIGERVVVVQRTGAAGRYLHVNTNRGGLQFATTGQTSGHAAALGGFGMAAANAQNPPVVFSGSTVVEDFSSDGPRRHFFSPDGTPITPGNFSSTGGAVAQNPT